jgi:hypothetical protein
VDVMDKLEKLKCQLIDAYATIVRRAQKGRPFEGYDQIREAMLAVNYIENFTLPQWQVITILDRYSNLLTLI